MIASARQIAPARVGIVEPYELAEAAERAGISPDELRQLVERGVLEPDATGHFTEGDVRRVGVVQSLVAAGIPIDLLADVLRSGGFSLAFIDDPAYERLHLPDQRNVSGTVLENRSSRCTC